MERVAFEILAQTTLGRTVTFRPVPGNLWVVDIHGCPSVPSEANKRIGRIIGFVGGYEMYVALSIKDMGRQLDSHESEPDDHEDR